MLTFKLFWVIRDINSNHDNGAGISQIILNYENGNTSENLCQLIGLKENSDSIARLDKYLKNIEGYVELTCKMIGCVDVLEKV